MVTRTVHRVHEITNFGIYFKNVESNIFLMVNLTVLSNKGLSQKTRAQYFMILPSYESLHNLFSDYPRIFKK